MATAAVIYRLANLFHIPLKIRNVCVFLAPTFSALTSLSAYHLSSEVSDTTTGLLAAFFTAIVPGYVSRSVSGSYDNEGVAIFALIFTFAIWVKAVKRGSLFYSSLTAIAYFYMVAAWGGYVFIINILPLHVLALTLMGKLDQDLYAVYSNFYITGTLLSFQVPFIGFQPVHTSEHMGALGVFGLIQLVMFYRWVQKFVSPKQFKTLMQYAYGLITFLLCVALLVSTLTGYLAPWSGRLRKILDPFNAESIAIIDSVSEHQPTTWASYFFDLHILTFLFPVGMYFCLKHLQIGSTFVLLYALFAVYFSGSMVRLMLVLAPIACQMGAIAFSSLLRPFLHQIKHRHNLNKTWASSNISKQVSQVGSLLFILVMTVLLIGYAIHCSWVTSEAYSSPSIVLAARGHDGSRVILDDFREAYFWLQQNTAPDAKIASWWDYAYQIAAMANRTTIVDNNTWNDTHIAAVGKILSLSEEAGIQTVRDLDIDYVLLVFGGLARYQSDDIAKLLWPIRISGGVYPEIQERDYFSEAGQYRIDDQGSRILHESLAFKMCYYNFAKASPNGFDPIRNQHIPSQYHDFQFKYYEEAFTSENWIVRIYRVLPPGQQSHHIK